MLFISIQESYIPRFHLISIVDDTIMLTFPFFYFIESRMGDLTFLAPVFPLQTTDSRLAEYH